MKKIILLFTFVLLFTVGCNNKEELRTLVCSGIAKNCTYQAVEASDIGEEEYVCNEEYGETIVTFEYKENDKWDNVSFITTYYEDKSTDEQYNILLDNCKKNCKLEKENGKIIYTEYYNSSEYQNGSIDKVKKYMNDIGYNCK
jgi:hypothetical protein